MQRALAVTVLSRESLRCRFLPQLAAKSELGPIRGSFVCLSDICSPPSRVTVNELAIYYSHTRAK